MLASFFYEGDVPTPETLLDMAREALVAELRNDMESETCAAMVDGLAKAWEAARDHERREESDADAREPCFDTAADAESAYHDRFMRAYKTAVQREYPGYNPSDDGVGWWPEGMTHRGGWPKRFVLAVAATLGEVDGDSTVATAKYFEERKAEEAKMAEAKADAEDASRGEGA